MKKIILFIIVAINLVSCNKEKIEIKGDFKNETGEYVCFKLKGVSQEEKIVKDSVKVEDQQFSCWINNCKPPFKICLSTQEGKEYFFWIFKYGEIKVSLDENALVPVQVIGDFENKERKRILENYEKMYISPLHEEVRWYNEIVAKEEHSSQEMFELGEIKKKIKKAKKLRKKSILSTFRKNPKHLVAMALVYDEFDHLTSWQQNECMKNAKKYYSDCGIFWQLKH